MALDIAFGYSCQNRTNISQLNASYLNTDYNSGFPGFRLAGAYWWGTSSYGAHHYAFESTANVDYLSSTVSGTGDDVYVLFLDNNGEIRPNVTNYRSTCSVMRCVAR